jgi:hypothetical protein
MSVRPAASLGLAQLRHEKARWSLLVAGIALVVAVPVVSAGMARSVTAQAVRQAISHLSVDDRTLLVSQEASSTMRVGTPDQANRTVHSQLARLTSTPARRTLIFRQLSADGPTFHIAGTDRLSSAVRLTSGRLPQACTRTRCEVLVVGAPAADLMAGAASLGLDVVGTAIRRDPLLAPEAVNPEHNPLLLTGDVDGLSRLASLHLYARYYVWATAVDADQVVRLGVADYIARSADVDRQLDELVGATSFARPDDLLQAADDRAQTSARRLRLLGGFAAVLLLGFAIVAGAGLRREMSVLLNVLRRRGAGRGATAACVVTAAATCAVVGAAAGAIFGGLVAAVWRTGTGLPPLTEAGHALADSAATAGGYAVASLAVVVALLFWPDARSPAVWRILELIAVACLGAAVLAAARGSADTGQVAGGDPIVIALPILACVVAGIVAARVWNPVTSAAQRVLPHRALAGRIALLGALRRPLRPAATVAFLTAAVAAVVFAGVYRATLLAGDADEAAFRVPLDVTLAASAQEPVPSRVVDPSQFSAVGAHAYGVLRTSATVVELAGVSTTLTVVAADHPALARISRWDRTAGGSSAAAVSDLLGGAVPQQQPRLPAGTRTITIVASGVDPNTTLTLWLRTVDGVEIPVALTAQGDHLLGRVVPDIAGALTGIAFTVDESSDYATHHQHAIGEGTNDQPLLSGRITLGAVTADGRAVAWDWSSWGSALGTVQAAPGTLQLGYRLAGDPVVANAGYAAVQGLQIPIVTDVATAHDATGGVLPFKLDGSTRVTGRVVGTVPRLPTVHGPFIFAERGALQQALDVHRPGRAPTEFWVAGSSPALDRLLASAPYNTLSITTRSHVQAQLDADPIGEGSRRLLVLVAVLALGVAALGLVLLVVGERRDGAGELFAWEADGLAPRLLRRVLILRAVSTALVGVPLGVLAGLIVARAGATLVSVDSVGRVPVPPLSVTFGSIWTTVLLLVGLGAGLLAACAVAALSLREKHPVPAAVDLR